MIEWVRHLVVKPTLGIWRYKNTGTPPQQARISDFCKINNVQTHYVGAAAPNIQYDMVTLLFAEQKFFSIKDIDDCLIKSMAHADKFLHLSVNKFLVYSDIDRNEHINVVDLDQRLIDHWKTVVNRNVVYVEYNSSDRGLLGNWEYPITNIIWRLHE